ncbi:MAG: 5-(carboxyamino)imidazole ribonucleotide mutase [Peptococcaceae bacterium]|jgi:5-(carboxyamino)imidazole ribonucleotide mutase|nr:5-(carboxyamino)imidazole ribonucleotide mutase [Peptococcaceae bacterium]
MVVVGVVMGSDSDFPVLEDAIEVLKQFQIPFEVKISSAHRTLHTTIEWVEDFEKRGGKIIIAAAGLAAHLPGVVAAATTLPVIGVPIKSGALEGVDALYSIVQMPPGIPVATVGINGARNAALLAVEMLSLSDCDLKNALRDYRGRMARQVEEKDKKIKQQLQSR